MDGRRDSGPVLCGGASPFGCGHPRRSWRRSSGAHAVEEGGKAEAGPGGGRDVLRRFPFDGVERRRYAGGSADVPAVMFASGWRVALMCCAVGVPEREGVIAIPGAGCQGPRGSVLRTH